MAWKAVWLAALGLTLVLGACGVYGPKGNDTGGIIPWSPVAESVALDTAMRYCSYYGKRGVITSVHRNYGNYIAYECRRGT